MTIELTNCKEEWSVYSDQLQFVQGDITKKQDIINIVDEAMERFGRIDFLINNAGPFIFERKKLSDYDEQEWDEMINGNLNSVYHLVKRTIPIMRKQKFGRIINLWVSGCKPGSRLDVSVCL